MGDYLNHSEKVQDTTYDAPPDPRLKEQGLGADSFQHMLNWFRLVLQKDHAELFTLHETWRENDLLMRNTGTEALDGGNLVSDFVGTKAHRMFSRPMRVHFSSDDPDSDTSASELEVIAQSLLRTSDLRSQQEAAYRDAQWAGTGWLCLDHPMNPTSMNYHQRRDMQLSSLVQPSNNQTDWAPADTNAMIAAGVDPEDDFDIDPTFMPPEAEEHEAKPLFVPLFSTPYAKRVDPRLMIFPPNNLRTLEQAWYLGRLHFFSPRQLARLFPDQVGGRTLPYNLTGSLQQIYRDTCAQRIEMQYSQIVCLVEVYFRDCALYPELNGTRVVFLWNYPTIVLYREKSPFGGMVPFVPVKPEKLKGIIDRTKVEELRGLALAYNEIVLSIGDRAHDALNLKWFEGPGMGMDPKEAKKVNNPTYKGAIKVQNVNDMKYITPPFDQGLLQALVFLRSQGQLAIGVGDMDSGKAVKDITARQVEILNSATGANMDAEREEMRKAATQALFMLLQFAGLYSQSETGQNYFYEGRKVYLEVGRHDLITSALFEVHIQEDGEDLSADEKLVLTQFMRLILQDPSGQLFAGLDSTKLLRMLLRKFGLSAAEVIKSQPALPPTPSMPGAEAAAPMLQGEGQHPERQIGDRGLSIANAMTGLRNTGGGLGE